MKYLVQGSGHSGLAQRSSQQVWASGMEQAKRSMPCP